MDEFRMHNFLYPPFTLCYLEYIKQNPDEYNVGEYKLGRYEEAINIITITYNNTISIST